MPSSRVVIIGGGITGLACAHYLRQRGIKAKVLEGSPRFGGNIFTESRDGFLLDAGPDSWVTQKPHAAKLAREVGLGDELISTLPSAKPVWVVRDSRLLPMPDGLVLGIPSSVRALLRASLFSPWGKLRALADLALPAKVGDADESVADFLRRRLGSEVADAVAGPMLGGVFSGDVADLSLLATFPQLREGERTHGSVMRAMSARTKPSTKRPAARQSGGAYGGSVFTSLRRGLGSFIDRLASHAEDAHRDARVVQIERLEQGYRVSTMNGDLTADRVVLTGRTSMLSHVLPAADPKLTRALGEFSHSSTATVFLACRAAAFDVPLRGAGFISPEREGRKIRAGTFVHCKWEQRAPEGHALLRVFFGDPLAVDASDETLIRIAENELAELTGYRRQHGLFRVVYRLPYSSSQPTVGHLARVEALRAHLRSTWPGVHVIGQGYDGAAIPDCIRQAESLADELAGSTSRASATR